MSGENDEEVPVKPDFNWVKKKVSDSLGDEESKQHWKTALKSLEDEGESVLRTQIESLAQSIKTEASNLLSDLKNKIPSE